MFSLGQAVFICQNSGDKLECVQSLPSIPYDSRSGGRKICPQQHARAELAKLGALQQVRGDASGEQIFDKIPEIIFCFDCIPVP